MSIIPDNVLTVEGAAARRGCSAATIWRWIKAGRLPSTRLLGRVVIEAADLDRVPGPVGGGRWHAPRGGDGR